MQFIKLLATAIVTLLALSACSTAGDATARKANLRGCDAGKALSSSPAGLQQVRLCIVSADKTRSYDVEVAASHEQQEKGLMYRTEIADNAGMIFPFPEARTASFWMKNTYIPLDIIFIRANGSIENIAENATPYSTDPIYANAPVTAVLELRGGLTGELGIKAGDKIIWSH
jgi:uncharacterized protein